MIDIIIVLLLDWLNSPKTSPVSMDQSQDFIEWSGVISAGVVEEERCH